MVSTVFLWSDDSPPALAGHSTREGIHATNYFTTACRSIGKCELTHYCMLLITGDTN